MNNQDLRPVEVRVGGHQKFKGFFHEWTQDIGLNSNGEEYFYKVAIIETEKGEITRVSPENIRFTDR